MSKGNTFETELLDHILNNANIALIGDATGLRGSSAAGSLYVALHTADPGEAGDQTTSETTYGSYARVAVTRGGGGWTVASGSAGNAGSVAFPAGTSGSQTVTHFSVGTASSGTGKILYSGSLSASRPVGTGITPTFGAGTLTISED